tara:strand:- start:28690 stop:29541 length:852 start_codon:yes stop_codon:yes gene_type:complete
MNNVKNIDIENKEDFFKNGIYVKKNFLKKDALMQIVNESESIFENKIDNTALGAQATTFKPNFFSITCPTLSISYNLFELSIDVLTEMETLDKQFNKYDYELTNIDILKDTNKELFWHTDNTSNFYRAFIYLKGGSKISGAFKYMIETHKRNYEVNHKLSNKIIKEKDLDKHIVICDYEPGTLIVSDINGFHSNSIKLSPRIIMILDFQKKDSNIGGSFLPIKTCDLSEKVLKDLELFSFKGSVNRKRDHGIEKRLNSIGNSTKPSFVLLKSIMRYFKDKIRI